MQNLDPHDAVVEIDDSVPELYRKTEDGVPVGVEVIDDKGLEYDSKGENEMYVSDIVPEVIYIERRPFRYRDIIKQIGGDPIIHNRHYLIPIYDFDPDFPTGSRNKVLQTARQVEKSTSAAVMGIVLGASIPSLKGLYVQPRFSQVTVFSQQRFKKIAEESPRIRWEMLSTKNLWQVSGKEFNTGAMFNFRSCYLSADPVRGISTDFLNIDEIQDVPSKEIAVIEECQSHALPDRKIRLYTGTPKTKMNALTQRYDRSCMFEWMVKCRWCPAWNYMDENVIGDRFFICTKCGKELYPKKIRDITDKNDYGGEWIAMKPSLLDIWHGYRISQIQVPFQSFDEVFGKLHDPEVSFSVFCNEVLGLPSEEGELVLTEADVLRSCEARNMAKPDDIASLVGGAPLFMGIDHGTGGRGQLDSPGKRKRPASYTVVVIGAWCTDEKFRVLYMEKFLGEKSNLARQPEYFDETARSFRVHWAASDWGFGHINNERLRDKYGWVDRSFGNPEDPLLLEMQSVKQRAMVKFDHKAGRVGRYMIDRTSCMNLIIDKIKKGIIRFPKAEVMLHAPNDKIPFINDFTSIFVEYDETYGTMSYDHTMPDDTFQATMLCYLAAEQYYGRFARTAMPTI